jgi:hypothetical protein
MALILNVASASRHAVVIHLPRGFKGPKRRLDLQDRHRHRAEANDPSFTSGATAAQSVVEKAATPRHPCLGKRDKERWLACGVPAYLYRDPTALWWCVPGGTGRPLGRLFSKQLLMFPALVEKHRQVSKRPPTD